MINTGSEWFRVKAECLLILVPFIQNEWENKKNTVNPRGFGNPQVMYHNKRATKKDKQNKKKHNSSHCQWLFLVPIKGGR